MNHLLHWITMGEYSSYVWSAYGIACVLLAFNGYLCHRQHRRVLKWLQTWFKQTSI